VIGVENAWKLAHLWLSCGALGNLASLLKN
jgi:hypothetical protein